MCVSEPPRTNMIPSQSLPSLPLKYSTYLQVINHISYKSYVHILRCPIVVLLKRPMRFALSQKKKKIAVARHCRKENARSVNCEEIQQDQEEKKRKKCSQVSQGLEQVCQKCKVPLRYVNLRDRWLYAINARRGETTERQGHLSAVTLLTPYFKTFFAVLAVPCTCTAG